MIPDWNDPRKFLAVASVNLCSRSSAAQLLTAFNFEQAQRLSILIKRTFLVPTDT
jgi:hypothetical protein